MTFKDLQKIIQITINRNNTTKYTEFDIFKDLPFWIWDSNLNIKDKISLTKGKCCYNHVLGLPRNNNDQNIVNPLFDYQESNL